VCWGTRTGEATSVFKRNVFERRQGARGCAHNFGCLWRPSHGCFDGHGRAMGLGTGGLRSAGVLDRPATS
jgi:hypothetical protein